MSGKAPKTEKNLQKKWKSLPYLLRVERKEVGDLFFLAFLPIGVFSFSIYCQVCSYRNTRVFQKIANWTGKHSTLEKCLAFGNLYFAVRCEGVVLQNSYPAYSSSVTFACHSKVITDLKNSSPQQISPEDVSITSSNRGKKTNILSTT